MRKRFGRWLISVAFVLSLSVPVGPAVFADSAHDHTGNASVAGNGNTKNDTNPGQAKKADAQPSGSAQNAQPSSQNSSSPGNSNHSQGTAGTSGTVSQPQPYSNADQNNTGANDTSSTNQYRSTRNGSPSLNGNGNGQATGKPCAGCVGKADNKNPQGQYPNGTDHNKGYECDKNNGIGKSNPAHTGCTSSTPACTGSNCGGHGGCTSNCGGNGCTTNCGGNPGCTTNCGGNNGCLTNCNQTSCIPTITNGYCLTASVCTTGTSSMCVTGGRGGGQVLGASTAAPSANVLPNTAAHQSFNWWVVLAVISLAGGAVYWRQLIMPLLLKR